MIFNLKDKFLIGDLLMEVRYINNSQAWLSPIEDQELGNMKYYAGCASTVLDDQGRDQYGYQAVVVSNAISGAV